MIKTERGEAPVFDKQTVKLYKSVRAPEELEQRVKDFAVSFAENEAQKQKCVFVWKNSYTRFVTAAVAAVFCVVIGFSATRLNPEIKITVNGENPDNTYVQVTQSYSGFALARSIEPDISPFSSDAENLNIELSCDISGDAQISVTKGFLIFPEISEDKYETFTLGKTSKLLWNIEGIEPDESARLIISGKRHEKVYVLENIDGIWTLMLEQ